MANEKRLIDANALMKAIKSFRWFGVPNTLKLMFDYLKIIIRDQPTVDAVEVVHGRWIEHIEMGAMNNHYECSACHWKTPSFTIAKGSNYCPECGAKMDK